MNRQQFEEARELLNNDCQLANRYVSEDGKKTCAIGCLAIAAGISPELLLKVNDKGIVTTWPDSISQDQGDVLSQIAQAIHAKFGLARTDLELIQSANDSVRDKNKPEDVEIRNRRGAVLSMLWDRFSKFSRK